MPSFHDMEPRTEAGMALNPQIWCDGVGRWHASVPLSSRPGETRHSGHAQREANAARALILAELQLREGTRENTRPSARDLNLHVTRERVTNHATVIYGEK